MITLKSILNEAYLNLIRESLSLEKAKEYTSIERNPEIQNQLDDIFSKLESKTNKKSKRGDRLYFKFNIETTSKSEIEPEVQSTIEKGNYKIKDYKKGIAQDKYGREVKLGKVLNKLKAKDILNKFNTDPIRTVKNIDTSYIVFSKHPYDIAGMTSGRKWADSSCMNLYGGSNAYYVQYDIEEGTIIAYMVHGNDLNIEKPIGRVLIKPFVNIDDKNNVLYVPEDKVYGENARNFRNKVVEVLEKLQGEKFGTFKLKGELYCDSKDEVTKHPKEIQDILDGKRKPKTKEEVKLLLDIYKIKNYTINNNLTVDVHGNVKIYNRGLNVIPIQFGVVKGYFDCSNSNLTSLEGAPEKVGSDFWCKYNKLTSLEGAPKEVGGSFLCRSNNLTSLEGAPEKVGGDFLCFDNNLTSLEGAPEKVGGSFDCMSNNLTSLEGAPEKVGGSFDCNNNKLKSLKGAPEKVGGYFDCNENDLTSLEGAPEKVGGSFLCSDNAVQFTEEDVRAVSDVKRRIYV